MATYRHGDVLLLPSTKTEGDLQKHQGSFTLSWGEVTGHHHVLSVERPENMTVYKAGDKLFICLMEIGTLTHEEHATLKISPGDYVLEMETEYDPCLESMRKVVD